MNQTARAEEAQVCLRRLVKNLRLVLCSVDVGSVVRSVDRDWHAVVLAESLRLLEELLGDRGRTADGQGHDGNGADVGLVGSRDAILGVELIESSLGGGLVDVGNDGRPALSGADTLLESALGLADNVTASEREPDSLDSERQQVAQGASTADGGSTEETSAQTDGSEVGGVGELGRVLGVISVKVSKCDSPFLFLTYPM